MLSGVALFAIEASVIKNSCQEKPMPSKKHKAHIIYKTADGKRVPGVTTITGELGWSGRVLINWANRMGLQGIDTTKYVDDKADIGTLAHAMVTDYLQGKKTDTDDYSKNQIAAAENSALSFFEWVKGKKIKPMLIEQPLVSEAYLYGGKPDIFAKVDGVQGLIDIKTGSGIYPEMIIQVGGGYRQLLVENGYEVESIRILNIPRTGDESFVEKKISHKHCITAWMIFKNCLKIYQLKKELK